MQLSRVLPGSLPLELRVRVSNEPVVTVKDGKATVTLKATIDFVSSALQAPQGRLFSLDMVSELPGDEMPSQAGRLLASPWLALPYKCPAAFVLLYLLHHQNSDAQSFKQAHNQA